MSGVHRFRVSVPVTDPETGQGRTEIIELRRRTNDPARARTSALRRLRRAGWEVDATRTTVHEVPHIIGAGSPAQRLRTLREVLGEDRETFAQRFLVPATAAHVYDWEAGRTLRPFELETLAYLERAAFTPKPGD